MRGLVLGTGINSDGREGGLSVPCGARQAALMRAVMARSGLTQDDLAFFEAHGTGTAVGDPIEAAAIGEAMAVGRSEPLPVGSIKSNIGHLEPASGLAGLLKAQLALEKGLAPPTLHIETVNPAIDFERLNIAPLRAPAALPKAGGGRRRAAGVNSFGFGGANASALICAPEAEPVAAGGRAGAPLILSAESEAALKALARRWSAAAGAERPEADAPLIAAAAYRRARLSRRLVVAAPDARTRAGALAAFAEDRQAAPEGAAWATETALPGGGAPVAFVFSGNGAQWPGMGVRAYAEDAAFREAFDRAAAAIGAQGGADVRVLLHAEDLHARLAEAEVAQPLLFALQVALTEALAARGVRPAMTAGHSVGEVAAAWAAGALTLEQAAMLAVRRARRQAPLFGTGGMAAVLASVEDAQAFIDAHGFDGLHVAADNSPRGATVSGPVDQIDAMIAAARSERLAVRKLRVDYPFHGPAMETIREALFADLVDIAPSGAQAPFYSTTEGRPVEGEALDCAYWWRNARQAVLFRQAVLAMAADGARVFLEIGPQPTLRNYIADTLTPAGTPFAAPPSLRRQGDGAENIDLIAARVVAAGGRIDEEALFGEVGRFDGDAPRYPWRMERYNFALTPERINQFRRQEDAPLLGWRGRPGEGPWRVTLDPQTRPWLADHVVDGQPALPAAAFAELGLAAAAAAWGEGPLELRDLDILRPVPFDQGARAEMRTTLDETNGVLRIETRRHLAEGGWALAAQATLRRAEPAPAAQEAAPRARHGAAPDASLYDALAARGLVYGPAFRRLMALDTLEPAAQTARAQLAPSVAAGAGASFRIDPTDLDAAFHLVAAILGATPDAGASGLCWLPVRMGRILLREPGLGAAAAEARLTRRGLRTVEAALRLIASDGRVIAEVDAARFAAVRLGRHAEAGPAIWRETPRPLRLAAPCAMADDAPPIDGERLAARGFEQMEPGERSDAALLADAACRRVVWRAARALAPGGGLGLRARRTYSRPVRAAFEIGLAALSAEGAYDENADIASESPCDPELPELIDAMVAVAPDCAQTVLDIARLDAALDPDRLADPAPRAGVGAGGWRALAPALEDAVSGRAACAALLIGDAPDGVVEALRAAGAARVERVRRLDAAEAQAIDRGGYDVVGAVDALDEADATTLRALREAMAAGGALLCARRETDLLDTVLSAMAENQGAGLAARLRETGWRHVEDVVLRAGAGAVALIGARAPARPAAETSEAEIPIALASAPHAAEAAAALESRLRARGRAAVVEADGSAAVVVAFPDPGADARALAATMEAVARDARPGATLWLVLRESPEAAGLARLRRVLANERPDADLRVAIWPEDAPAAEAMARLAPCLDSGTEETEIRLADAPSAARIEAAPDVAERAARAACGPEPALSLAVDATAGLETLRWRPHARRAPGPGEIEIEVRATGLNFRDVMWAMGVLPEEAVEDGFAGGALGMECAGVVARAGEGARFAPGDAVVAFAKGAFATHVVTPDGWAGRLPEGLDFEAGASLPVVFGTAWRGLVDLGRIEPGETALIHGGAGGVGLAAIQIALARGARVLATAGSPEKRALLERLGCDAAFDSRGRGFAEEVMAATGGRGVDVVLNALAGESMERTLECVAPFGRFVELGKRDFYENTRIGLRPLRRNVSYFGVDLDAMLAARPESAAPLLEALARQVEDGVVGPPPMRVFEGDHALEAFRLMQRSGHVGKLVVSPPPVSAVASAAPAIRADAAYLVTGGARGFGLAFAERLVARGARRIWLTSISGATDMAADAAIARMRAVGAAVHIAACDVADGAAMEALFARIDADGAPLAGVAHAATRMDDRLMEGADAAGLEAVLRPKLEGARLLDRMTGGRDLDFFVLFSSVAALFGNPGQGAYVAANAAMERIAADRIAQGLPALAIGFGPIADAGMLAGDEAARAMLERRGARPMTAEEALDALETAMAGREAQDAALTIAPMRWAALAADIRVLAEPLFEEIDTRRVGGDAEAGGDLRALIADLDEAGALRALTRVFREEAATILRLPAEEVDPDRPMSELGFDSLMAVELKLTAEEKFGVSLPIFSLADGATLSGVAARVSADLRAGDCNGDPGAEDAARELLARHVGGDIAAAAARVDDMASAGEGAR